MVQYLTGEAVIVWFIFPYGDHPYWLLQIADWLLLATVCASFVWCSLLILYLHCAGISARLCPVVVQVHTPTTVPHAVWCFPPCGCRYCSGCNDYFSTRIQARCNAQEKCANIKHKKGQFLHYVPWREILNWGQFAFTTVLLYHTAIYSTKFSILAFYAKLFPPTSQGLRIGCYAAIVYTACCYMVALFLAMFWCGPNVSRNFETGPGACTVWSYALFKINFSLNISSDILSKKSYPSI
jgi:hypothetical protein